LEADLKGLFEQILFYSREGYDSWTLESILKEICGKGSMHFGTNPPRGLWRRPDPIWCWNGSNHGRDPIQLSTYPIP